MSNAMKKNYSANERYSTNLGQCEHWDDGILCLRLILYLLCLSICSYAQTDSVFNPTNSLVPQCFIKDSIRHNIKARTKGQQILY
jgi:hypothetical protein